jgi:hypothetical protein
MPMPLNSRRFFCLLLAALFVSLNAHAQTTQAEWERRARAETERVPAELRQQHQLDSRMRDLREMNNRSPNDVNRVRYVSKLTAEQKKMLQPTEAQKDAFADFLRQPDTGLARLLPRERFDHPSIMPLRGGDAFYSFNKTSHEPSPFTDIVFQGSRFWVGVTGRTYALMTEQGKTPLEQLTIDNAAVRFLRDLVPPASYQDFLREMEKNTEGFEVGGNLYKTFLPARLNSTYVLRSTLYNSADTVIAFRVVELDADGSATLLWKRLYKLTPKKLKDVKAVTGDK